MRSMIALFSNIQWLLDNLAAMWSIEALVPKGLLQRMQRQGSSCLIRMGTREVSVKFSWGCSLITFSGQVFLHRPHWTQASSVKLSIGRSGLSDRAPAGQAGARAGRGGGAPRA